MTKRLYAGNLPYNVDDEQLKGMFAPHGQVDSAKVIMDKFSGRSKGFGFVEMPNDGEADQAIAKLHGTNVGGRDIVVNEARPMEPRRSGGGGGRPSRDGGRRRDFGGGRGDRERSNRW